MIAYNPVGYPMRRILFIVIALILYGSFYPWDFHYRHLVADPLFLILHSWPDRLSRNLLRDALLNVLIYIPLGAAAFMTLARRSGAVANVCLSVMIGLVLSTTVEIVQLFDRSRVSSPVDILTNTAGALVGASLA